MFKVKGYHPNFDLALTGVTHFEVPSGRKCSGQELRGALYTQKNEF